jgi:hypothetical protein
MRDLIIAYANGAVKTFFQFIFGETPDYIGQKA